jgi:hypothetical protein
MGEEWNHPSRSDHYIMRLICEMVRMFHKNPSQVTPDDFRIPFKRLASSLPSTHSSQDPRDRPYVGELPEGVKLPTRMTKERLEQVHMGTWKARVEAGQPRHAREDVQRQMYLAQKQMERDQEESRGQAISERSEPNVDLRDARTNRTRNSLMQR